MLRSSPTWGGKRGRSVAGGGTGSVPVRRSSRIPEGQSETFAHRWSLGLTPTRQTRRLGGMDSGLIARPALPMDGRRCRRQGRAGRINGTIRVPPGRRSPGFCRCMMATVVGPRFHPPFFPAATGSLTGLMEGGAGNSKGAWRGWRNGPPAPNQLHLTLAAR
jgi:hypothetical protein